MNNTNIKLTIIKFNGKSKCLKYRYPDNIDFNLKVYVVIWNLDISALTKSRSAESGSSKVLGMIDLNPSQLVCGGLFCF